jgi:nucleoside-diphosphate-sugar epimerase
MQPGELVCVTGASGFIASELVASLLARGLRVNGTVRSVAKAAHLQILPGAAERLVLFEADLLGDGTAFDAAVAGCRVVFHTACPFIVTARAAELGESFFVQPAVKGTEAVLAACARAGGASLRRVVLTSSCAAIFKKNVPADHVYDEGTWNDPVCYAPPNPLHRAKITRRPRTLTPNPNSSCTRTKKEELVSLTHPRASTRSTPLPNSPHPHTHHNRPRGRCGIRSERRCRSAPRGRLWTLRVSLRAHPHRRHSNTARKTRPRYALTPNPAPPGPLPNRARLGPGGN